MFIRGGLYLANTVAIFASTSNVVVADGSIYQRINQLNQIWWRIQANNAIVSANPKDENAWIKNPYYYDSIVKVIGKAIGDCVTGEKEFKEKSRTDIITFGDAKASLKFSRANWNAVILYNYALYKKDQIYGTKHFWTTDDVASMSYAREMNEVIENILDCYKDYYTKHDLSNFIPDLENAIKTSMDDINKYNDAIGLRDKLNTLFITAKLYDTWRDKSDKNAQFASECAWYFDQMCSADDLFKKTLNLLYKTNIEDDMSKAFNDTVNYSELLQQFKKFIEIIRKSKRMLHSMLLNHPNKKNIDSFYKKQKNKFDIDLQDIRYNLETISSNNKLAIVIGYRAHQSKDSNIATEFSDLILKILDFYRTSDLKIIPNSMILTNYNNSTPYMETLHLGSGSLFLHNDKQISVSLLCEHRDNGRDEKFTIDSLGVVSKPKTLHLQINLNSHNLQIPQLACNFETSQASQEDWDYLRKLLEGLIDK